MNDLEYEECYRCKGSGIDPVLRPVCCQRAQYECGGLGCTGPEPEQQYCRDCYGQTKLPFGEQ